jgi:hypothetical protein
MPRTIKKSLRPLGRELLPGLGFLFLVGLLFLTAGGHDAYRTAGRWRKIRQQGGKYQVVPGAVVQADHPWFALTMSRFGGWKWYRVQYGFVTSQGQTVQGEDWIYRSSSPPDSLLIAYLPADPASNRIYTSEGIYDEHEYWGQGVVGGLSVVVGGFFMGMFCWVLKNIYD